MSIYHVSIWHQTTPSQTLICKNGVFGYQQWLKPEPEGYVFRERNSKTGKWPVTETIPEIPKPTLHHIIVGTNLPSITIVYFSGFWCQTQLTHSPLISLMFAMCNFRSPPPRARHCLLSPCGQGRARMDSGGQAETLRATACGIEIESEGCSYFLSDWAALRFESVCLGLASSSFLAERPQWMAAHRPSARRWAAQPARRLFTLVRMCFWSFAV